MTPDFIEKLKAGNENAFRDMVEEFQSMIFSTCLGIVHDRDDADDVTQEVFIQAYHTINKFRGDSKLSTWLYRIAINKSLNFVRSNKRTKFFQSIGLINSNEIADEEDYDPLDKEQQEQQRSKILHQAIDSLPKNQRAAFVLNKYEELSYKEIAEVLELSHSSIESLIFRAKKNLQKKLMHHYKSRIDN